MLVESSNECGRGVQATNTPNLLKGCFLVESLPHQHIHTRIQHGGVPVGHPGVP